MRVCSNAMLRQHRAACVAEGLGVRQGFARELGSTIRALIYHAELRM